MTEPDWSTVAEIFSDALELPRPEREKFVAERCRDQPDLRAAVERLLNADDAADPAFMRELPASVAELVHEGTAPPERVGAYRVVREIGSGGMGQVFLAERADGQFEQRVAVKLLKRGMDSEAILTRFLRERQILAALEHPNIARLIDGGVAEDGRPYFVMEYVEGLPITRYCDERGLGIDDRLRLFITVCSAVEYAHRNLVVHRDLKPANILVTADGRPMLLDFGIAKVISSTQQETAAPTLNETILTPEYAAPEQFQDGPVTTATDVYSAGAVLFQLLSGRRPFSRENIAERMTGAGQPDPPTLSSVVPPQLRRRVRGDLDTIVATALQAAPERRYASMEALREDIRRHQQRLPVKARPDSAAYRASRFVRRHQIGVSAMTVIAVLVLAFGVTTAIQSARIRRAAAELEIERDRAQREAAASQQVANFLVGLFEVADPMVGGAGDSLRAVQLLDRGAERIEMELGGQRELQARMLSVVGRAFDNLRRSDRAEPLVQRALALQRDVSGGESPAVVSGLQQLARVQFHRGEFPKAEASLNEALAIQDRKGAGREGSDPLTWSLLVDLVSTIHGTGHHERAVAAAADAAAMFDRMPPDHFRDSPAELARIAQLVSYTGSGEQMEKVYARLADLQRGLAGERSVAVAAVYTDWGAARQRRRNIQAADSLLSLALAIHEENDSTSVPAGHTLLALADIAVSGKDFARADSLYRLSVEIFRLRLGEDHRMVATARTQLAETLNRRGRFADAIPLYQQAVATYERAPGDAAGLAPAARWRLATALRGAGRIDESIASFEGSLRAFEAGFPADYLLTANLRRDYGAALVDAGRFAKAEPMLRQAIDVLGKRWGKDNYRTDVARISLGRSLAGQGRQREAREILRAASARLNQARGADDSLAVRARDALETIDRKRPRPGS